MDKLDKLSLLLVLGIIMLVCTNAVIICRSWIVPIEVDISTGTQSAAAAPAPVGKSAFDHALVLHDNTAITNTGSFSLWLRARIIFPDASQLEDHQIISQSLEHGFWEFGNNRWFYYALPVAKNQSTEPLIDQIISSSNGNQSAGQFRMQVEIAPEIWLYEKPETAYDAFQQLSFSPCIAEKP